MSDAVVKALQKKASLSAYQPTFREKASDVLRALLFSDDREGQRKAERLSNVLETVTPYGVATGIDDMREAVGQGDYATAGMMGAMAMVPGPSPKIKAYHGSPHSFDRFSMDKIGTGEGAQAYGHGLYFAENEGVAKSYKDALGGKADLEAINAEMRNVANAMDKLQITYNQPKSGMEAEWRALKDQYDALMEKRSNLGSMYEVEINASPDDFLDWDKPLSEQPGIHSRLSAIPEVTRNQVVVGGDNLAKAAADRGAQQIAALKVQTALKDGKTVEQAIAEVRQLSPREDWQQSLDTIQQVLGGGYEVKNILPPHWAGSNIFDNPSIPEKDLSKKLREAGIPGIKYLDAGSRGKGDGSRNYVVFDENLINIVRKYGIAGASAMLGYNLMDSVDPAQAKQLEQLEQVRKLDAIFGGAK